MPLLQAQGTGQVFRHSHELAISKVDASIMMMACRVK